MEDKEYLERLPENICVNSQNIEEDEFEESNDDLFNITSFGADFSFRELIDVYKEGELIKPELQRKYVWKKKEASRFIESILLGLPIPSIFLANTKDNRRLIIDGYQRIMTVYDYVERGIFGEEDKFFKLVNANTINHRWRGKSFSELSASDQRKIKNTTIHAIIFEQKKPENNDSSLFQVFERINTSGKTLNAQEIRNCIYQGNLNSLLFELNKLPKWRKLYGEDKEDSRMLDIENILRFFAINSEEIRNITSNRISLKSFLNKFMGASAHNNIKFIEAKRTEFTKVIDFLYENLGEHAFQGFSISNNNYTNRFKATIFDSVAIATAYAISKNRTLIDNLKERHLQLLSDKNFQEYSTKETTVLENLKGRIEIATKILYDLDYE